MDETATVTSTDSPFQPVAAMWLKVVKLGLQAKNKRFGKDAEDAMKFFSGPYDWLYQQGGGRHFTVPEDRDFAPTFQMTLNKASELVQLFGPSLYHRNPVRQVSPRAIIDLPPALFGNPNDPATAQTYMGVQQQQEIGRQVDAARAALLQAYLNATPTSLDLKTESRKCIDEALIKGAGLLWSETYRSPGSPTLMIGSFFDTIDNLSLDPDARELKDAKWCARRCIHPVWEVEREYGLAPGTLKANHESVAMEAAVSTDPVGGYKRQVGQTNDLLEYWKVWSKTGVGNRLTGGQMPDDVVALCEQAGDFVYVVVADGVPFPLNFPPDAAEQVARKYAEDVAKGLPPVPPAFLQWPTPFWKDDGWPFAMLSFHWIPNDIWPQSHLAPAFGELKFLNWIYSFIAGKLATTCRDLVFVRESLSEEVKKAVQSGKDLTVVPFKDEDGDISKMVQFLQYPSFNGDIWKVVEAVAEQFDRRTGLNELMYGESSRQLRSASEANLKSTQMNIRPDDMANSVEDFMTLVARMEALAARYHLAPNDVLPVLGPVNAQFWGTLLYEAKPEELLNQLEYRVEAGSTRKPNRERDAANMNQVMQQVFPVFVQAAAAGQPGPANAALQEWGKTMDLDFAAKGMVIPAPPAPMPAPGPAAPPPAPQQ